MRTPRVSTGRQVRWSSYGGLGRSGAEATAPEGDFDVTAMASTARLASRMLRLVRSRTSSTAASSASGMPMTNKPSSSRSRVSAGPPRRTQAATNACWPRARSATRSAPLARLVRAPSPRAPRREGPRSGVTPCAGSGRAPRRAPWLTEAAHLGQPAPPRSPGAGRGGGDPQEAELVLAALQAAQQKISSRSTDCREIRARLHTHAR